MASNSITTSQVSTVYAVNERRQGSLGIEVKLFSTLADANEFAAFVDREKLPGHYVSIITAEVLAVI